MFHLNIRLTRSVWYFQVWIWGMETAPGHAFRSSPISFPCLDSPGRLHFTSLTYPNRLQISPGGNSSPKTMILQTHFANKKSIGTLTKEAAFPTMSDILEASRRQKLDLQLQTIGPFFSITAKSLETHKELGRAEGLIRLWLGGKILHLDSIRLRRDTLGMEKSIFGIGLFIGAVAIRYGYDCGCRKAELLAINDTHLYHSKVKSISTFSFFFCFKYLFEGEGFEQRDPWILFVWQLVRFYTRIGFKAVVEVTGSSLGDFAHMLVWGGVGTRMDANLEELLIKWCTRFKPHNQLPPSWWKCLGYGTEV